MNPTVHVQPAVRNFVRCHVEGTDAVVYIRADGQWVCIFDDAAMAVWVRAWIDATSGPVIMVGIDHRCACAAAALPNAA